MTDAQVRTHVKTRDGWLAFQRYFVEQQCRPEVLGFSFEGAATARAHPDFLAAMKSPALRAVIICPSNPLISVDPILALHGVREALRHCAAPVIAVSPVIGGRAVKGPTAKMLRELGLEVSAAEVARRYQEFLDGYVIDDADSSLSEALPMPVVATKTLMLSLADREHVARVALALADRMVGIRK
jgi:LPPG:FO 2-phospho-L-lactate transferase